MFLFLIEPQPSSDFVDQASRVTQRKQRETAPVRRLSGRRTYLPPAVDRRHDLIRGEEAVRSYVLRTHRSV